MTRLEKKCLTASFCLHGVLLGVVVLASAFRARPDPAPTEVLTMIPQNLLDAEGSGGGAPEAAPAPPAPVVQTPPPAPHPEPPQEPIHPEPVVHEAPRPQVVTPPVSLDPAPHEHQHVVHPTLTPVNPPKKNSHVKPTEETDTAESSAAAARRARNAMRNALRDLAENVHGSGAAATVVAMPGESGGASFAGYKEAVYSCYYAAWVTPDSVTDRTASATVKIVVARDGSIISSEIVNKSGESALDRSVEKALRSVTQLPPFPSGARDEQRTFLIRFNLDAK